jgi:hypothetical protein
MTSGNRAKETKAAYDSPLMCSRRSIVRPLWTWPSNRVSISPEPHRRRFVADGTGSPAVAISVCWISQAISPDVACRAASALAFSARPRRSADSVHLLISAPPTASSMSPSPRSPRLYAATNWDSTPPENCARTPRWPSRTPR